MIRGDINAVEIHKYSSVGDNTVIQTVASLPSGLSSKVEIHPNVTIQEDCSLSSCIIYRDAFIGAKSVILEGARVGAGAMVAPGSVVPPGRFIPAGTLWAGNPVEYVKDLTYVE